MVVTLKLFSIFFNVSIFFTLIPFFLNNRLQYQVWNKRANFANCLKRSINTVCKHLQVALNDPGKLCIRLLWPDCYDYYDRLLVIQSANVFTCLNVCLQTITLFLIGNNCTTTIFEHILPRSSLEIVPSCVCFKYWNFCHWFHFIQCYVIDIKRQMTQYLQHQSNHFYTSNTVFWLTDQHKFRYFAERTTVFC